MYKRGRCWALLERGLSVLKDIDEEEDEELEANGEEGKYGDAEFIADLIEIGESNTGIGEEEEDEAEEDDDDDIGIEIGDEELKGVGVTEYPLPSLLEPYLPSVNASDSLIGCTFARRECGMRGRWMVAINID